MEPSRIICQTDRLHLREFTMDDLEPLAAIHLDPEVARFIGPNSAEQTRDKLCQWIAAYRSQGFSKWAVVLRDTGELIGRCGLALERFDGISEPELGWTFARAHWGHGYATEAAAAAMQHCFQQLKLRRIISLIDPQNFASQKVALRLEMAFERIVEWKGVPAQLYARFAP